MEDISQFSPNIIKSIRQYERINKKICRQKISIMFNEICINEEMRLKYTHTHTHTHTHIYIYIYHLNVPTERIPRINFYLLRTFCPHLGSFCVVSSFTTFRPNFTSGLLQVIYHDLGEEC